MRREGKEVEEGKRGEEGGWGEEGRERGGMRERRERRDGEEREKRGRGKDSNLTTSNLFVAGRIPLQVMFAVTVWSPSYKNCTHTIHYTHNQYTTCDLL